MSFSKQEIDRVKRQVRLLPLVLKRTRLKQSGRSWVGRCPFHADRNPSFKVDDLRNTFRCYSSKCGKSGSVIDWMIEAEGCRTFADAMRALGGDEVKRDPEHLKRLEAENARSYLKVESQIARQMEKQRRKAYQLWCKSVSLAGSVGESYLREARGLGDVHLPARRIRFIADLPYWAEVSQDQFEVIHRGPAMLAAFQWPDGRFAALHQTWIAQDGSGKAFIELDGQALPAKKMRGPVSGSALVLSRPAAIMAVGEGIETSLSAVAVGLAAVCAGSKANMVGAGLPDGVREPHPVEPGRFLPTVQPDLSSPRVWLPDEASMEILLADGDTKDLHSLRAELERASVRARLQGRSASILWPGKGQDLNDMLKTMKGAGA